MIEPKKSEKKRFLNELDYQFGTKIKRIGFPITFKGERFFLVSNDLDKVELSKLRVEKIGLYVGSIDKFGLRLTIEGTQIFGPFAKKNIIEISEEEVKKWINGLDLENKKGENYVIVKHGNDYLGCGKISGERLLNYLPKVRVIKKSPGSINGNAPASYI